MTLPRMTPTIEPGSSLWFACTEPERPTDASVVWHYACEGPCLGCQVKAAAVARQHPDDPAVRWLVEMVGYPPLYRPDGSGGS